MAIVHVAQLVPTKLELMARWLPAQPWYAGGADRLEALGAFRFDDPDGEVGVQVHVVHSGPGSAIYQIPMTYRPEPLDDAADALMGEMEHSVLGTRYVYAACHDARPGQRRSRGGRPRPRPARRHAVEHRRVADDHPHRDGRGPRAARPR